MVRREGQGKLASEPLSVPILAVRHEVNMNK